MTTNTARNNNYISLNAVKAKGFSVSISIGNTSVHNCINIV